MAKYGTKAKKKVARAMHERKAGTLRSGSGKKVTSRKQAIAIGLSEARAAGGKVPRKSAAKKSAKRSAKKSSAKKSAKKTSAKKSTRKRSTSSRKRTSAKKR